MNRFRVVRSLQARPCDQEGALLYLEVGLVLAVIPSEDLGRLLFRVLDSNPHLGRLFSSSESDFTECTEEMPRRHDLAND